MLMKDLKYKLIWWLKQEMYNYLVAEHPLFHDEGIPLLYKIECPEYESTDLWIAEFEGSIIYKGCLDECILKCQEDANQEIREEPKTRKKGIPSHQEIYKILKARSLKRQGYKPIKKDK